MKAVTYSLKVGGKNSEEYYETVKKFSDEVMKEAKVLILPIVHDYMNYIEKFKLEPVREETEYVLELLSLGILWRTYAHIALSVKRAPYIPLIYLGEWRKKHQRLKPLIDLLRGVLITLFLLPEKTKTDYAQPSLDNIDRVCTWFEATSEFREHALRFVRWRAYWGTLPEEEQKIMFVAVSGFRKWFEKRSVEVLGKYTQNVDSFIENNKKKYRWREDRISCNRSRGEYHLNMVGAELLNRSYKNDYSDTKQTALLLPGCMRGRTSAECKAKKLLKGLKCVGCLSECRVNKLRIEGKNNNFEVYVIPHASDLSLWTPKEGEPRCGVIASACVTTLVEGGLELKRYGIPAQCVLLDYSGCKKHWHQTGLITSLNTNELERVLVKN